MSIMERLTVKTKKKVSLGCIQGTLMHRDSRRASMTQEHERYTQGNVDLQFFAGGFRVMIPLPAITQWESGPVLWDSRRLEEGRLIQL